MASYVLQANGPGCVSTPFQPSGMILCPARVSAWWSGEHAGRQSFYSTPAGFHSVVNAPGEKGRRIRRGLALYGGVEFTVASSPEEVTEYLWQMVALHQASWLNGGKTGVFHDERILGFHEQLLNAPPEAGSPAIFFRPSAGGRPIGILYSLQYGAKYYAYQSGFLFSPDNKLSPGTLSHALCLDYLSRNGAKTYNFLAGDFDYKRAFTPHGEHLVWLEVAPRRLSVRQ